MKTEENVKTELLETIEETNEKCNSELDRGTEWVPSLEDAISMIKQHEKVTMNQNRKLLNCKLHLIFFETVGLSRSTIEIPLFTKFSIMC